MKMLNMVRVRKRLNMIRILKLDDGNLFMIKTILVFYFCNWILIYYCASNCHTILISLFALLFFK